MHLIVIAFTVIVSDTLKGSELYEALYKAGYGSEGTMVHYHPILSEVKAVGAKVRSILDIGCSHGGGVKALWDSGKIASGVDISSSAVDMARSRHGDHPEMCISKCWQPASATSLPFQDSSFDAIMSTDVLEHLEPSEVDAAVRELTRVARSWLFLKISNRGESSRMDRIKAPVGRDASDTFANVVRRKYNRDLPLQLHTTVRDGDWWIAKFTDSGFHLHHHIKMPSWACCGFVLHVNRSRVGWVRDR